MGGFCQRKNGYWLVYPPAQRYCGRERNGGKGRQTVFQLKSRNVSSGIELNVSSHNFEPWTSAYKSKITCCPYYLLRLK